MISYINSLIYFFNIMKLSYSDLKKYYEVLLSIDIVIYAALI